MTGFMFFGIFYTNLTHSPFSFVKGYEINRKFQMSSIQSQESIESPSMIREHPQLHTILRIFRMFLIDLEDIYVNLLKLNNMENDVFLGGVKFVLFG